MTEEFNLSDYIIDTPQGVKLIAAKNVEEFIKRLKEFYKDWGSKNELNDFLNKLAGPKLI